MHGIIQDLDEPIAINFGDLNSIDLAVKVRIYIYFLLTFGFVEEKQGCLLADVVLLQVILAAAS